MPRIIDALRVAQTADAVQRRQPFDRQLVQQRRRQLEVVFLEREIAKQVERLALFIGRDRLVRNPAVRVADVVAMMINAADEFGGREQPVVVFVQPATQRATEDLIAFTRFGESGFHRAPKLADDVKAPAEVGERIGRGVELIVERVDSVRRKSSKRVFVRGIRQHRVSGTRSDSRQISLFIPLKRFVCVFDGPVVVRPKRHRNKVALPLAFRSDDDGIVVHN